MPLLLGFHPRRRGVEAGQHQDTVPDLAGELAERVVDRLDRFLVGFQRAEGGRSSRPSSGSDRCADSSRAPLRTRPAAAPVALPLKS